MVSTKTPLQKQTYLALALWELGSDGSEFKKGDLSKKTPKLKDERDQMLDRLAEKGIVLITPKSRTDYISLKSEFKQELLSLLNDPAFQFSAQIGQAKANSLLHLLRSRADDVRPSGHSDMSHSHNGKATASQPISSYEDFKTTILNVYDRINQDFNMDDLVPIYRIRREVGDRISRSDFNEWLLDMQADDIFQLMEASVEDGALDKIEDSVKTSFGELRCYAKLLSS